MSVATRVPYVDLAAQHAPLRSELLSAVERVLDHGGFILGHEVEELERRFAALCGTRHAVGVSNGTAAIVLTLKALGIGEGDEVISAPNSFLASVSSIALSGALPVLVDVRDDLNIDPGLIEAAITSRTRAILPVHLTGRPAAMGEIREIAGRHGLIVIEDAAQAVGAELDGRRVGSLGDAAAFSFHPLKNLNAVGDGGVITTDDDDLAAWLRTARNHGLESRDVCAFWSPNERLDALQAAILCVKLEHLDRWTSARRENARVYRDGLADVAELSLPQEVEGETAVYHTFVIQAERRDELGAHLAEHDVETKIHYPIPIHLQPAAASLGYHRGDFPECERQCGRILSLPVHPDLAREQIDHVVHCIRGFYESSQGWAGCDGIDG